jgi:hypothetical protein
MEPKKLVSSITVKYDLGEKSIVFIADDEVNYDEMEYVDPESSITQMTYSSDLDILSFRTNNDELFAFNFPRSNNTAPVNDMKTVYLDQSQWVKLHKAVNHPEEIKNTTQLAAYQKLAEYAEEGKIILPIANIHLLETSELGFTEERRELAKTMLRFSAGWQMLHPMYIEAFAQGFADDPLESAVFKVEPFSLEQHTHDPSLRVNGYSLEYNNIVDFIYEHMDAYFLLATMLLDKGYGDILAEDHFGINDFLDIDYLMTASKVADFALGSRFLADVADDKLKHLDNSAFSEIRLYDNVNKLIVDLDKAIAGEPGEDTPGEAEDSKED